MKRAQAEALRLTQIMEEVGLWRTREVYAGYRTQAEATQNAENRGDSPWEEDEGETVRTEGKGRKDREKTLPRQGHPAEGEGKEVQRRKKEEEKKGKDREMEEKKITGEGRGQEESRRRKGI